MSLKTFEPDPAPGKVPASDTKRAAPRRMIMFVAVLAIFAVVVLLLGLHYTGGIK